MGYNPKGCKEADRTGRVSGPLCIPYTSMQCVHRSRNIILYLGNFISQSKVKSLSRVQLFVTPWTVAYQVPPSKGFSRQEYLSGLPFPPPGDLPDPGIEPVSPALQTDSLPSELPGNP